MGKVMWQDASVLMDRLASRMRSPKSAVYDYYTKLGEISTCLVEYRVGHNLSQAGLAKLLDVSQAMVSKYESGDYNFSVKTLTDLCSKLNLNLMLKLEPKTDTDMLLGAADEVDIGAA